MSRWCPILLEEAEVASHGTGQTHKLRISATCKSNGIVYVIQCKRCGLQYARTGQALHERLNSHRSGIRRGKTSEKPVAAHFCSNGHTLSDLDVIVVDQLQQNDAVLRKNRESRWIKILKTEAPNGMNLRVDRL